MLTASPVSALVVYQPPNEYPALAVAITVFFSVALVYCHLAVEVAAAVASVLTCTFPPAFPSVPSVTAYTVVVNSYAALNVTFPASPSAVVSVYFPPSTVASVHALPLTHLTNVNPFAAVWLSVTVSPTFAVATSEEYPGM